MVEPLKRVDVLAFLPYPFFTFDFITGLIQVNGLIVL